MKETKIILGITFIIIALTNIIIIYISDNEDKYQSIGGWVCAILLAVNATF